jgi:hypothetical protein
MEETDKKSVSSIFVPGAGTELCELPASPLKLLYPEPESNRHGHYWPLDFKSSASTNSAIRALIG